MKSYCPNDCGICKMNNEICYYDDNNLSWKCPMCKEYKSPHDVYENKRGSQMCPECHDKFNR